MGGAEEHMATLACELSKRGHSVAFFSRCYVPPENQYLARMRASGVQCHVLSRWIDYYIVHRESWRLKLIDLCTTLFVPFLWFVAWIDAQRRKRSIQRSFVGCRGALIGLLSRFCPAQEPELLFDAWALRRLPKCLRQVQPDVIHAHRTHSLRLVGSDILSRFPVVYTEHGTPTEAWDDLSAYLNKATAVIAVSEPSKDAIRQHWKCTRPIIVIPSPVPDPGESDPMLRSEKKSTVTITFIGRIDANKNVLLLLDVLRILVDCGLDVRLMIAGDGPLFHDLRCRTEELMLFDFVNFYGSFDHNDIPEIMSKTDIITLLSFSEGLPIALMEAMAYGKPIVASAVGGIPCLVENGVNGFLVDPMDLRAITDALKTLASDFELRKQMGAEARKRYLALGVTPEKVTDAIERIYQQAIILNHTQNDSSRQI